MSTRRGSVGLHINSPRKGEQTMSAPIRTAVIYYSATGNVHRLAEAAAEGAERAGSQTRLVKVRELAGETAINSNEAWRTHVDTSGHVDTASVDDLAWADVVIFGAPTRYGNVPSQLQQFRSEEHTSELQSRGHLVCRLLLEKKKANQKQRSNH